jgi:hypothetical protein
MEVLISSTTAYFISKDDGARHLASLFCAINPMWIALDKSMKSLTPEEERDFGIKSLWAAFGISFVVNFIASMISVRNTVTMDDLEKLLIDTMSLLCTGAASGYTFLMWDSTDAEQLFEFRRMISLEQSIALLSYFVMALGCSELGVFVALSFTLAISLFVFGNFHAMIGISISILLAVRLEETFRSVSFYVSHRSILSCISSRTLF